MCALGTNKITKNVRCAHVEQIFAKNNIIVYFERFLWTSSTHKSENGPAINSSLPAATQLKHNRNTGGLAAHCHASFPGVVPGARAEPARAGENHSGGTATGWPVEPVLLLLDSFAPDYRQKVLQSSSTHGACVWILRHYQ